MRSEFRRQLELKTLQMEESLKIQRREMASLEKSIHEVSSKCAGHEQSFRKVKERILLGVSSEPAAVQVVALKALGTKLKGEADALSKLTQQMQTLQLEKKAKAGKLITQNHTLETIKDSIKVHDKARLQMKESAELDRLLETESVKRVQSEALATSVKEAEVINAQVCMVNESMLPQNQNTVVVTENLLMGADGTSSNTGQDNGQASALQQENLNAQDRGEIPSNAGCHGNSLEHFQENVEKLEAWNRLSNSGVDLTYVSDGGSRIGMQIVGGDGIPLKVVLTPQGDADQRSLFNSKGKILESLRSKGLKVREVIVAGGVRE